jgi:CheY-like chemotaxis protein
LEPDVGRRGIRQRVRLGYLSLFRPLDAEGRVRRALGALAGACEKGFDHLVISGDLTEDGTGQQFDEVARVLFESRIDPSKVTLVPGNHDAYDDPREFARALEGPLRPFASTSGGAPGQVVDLGDVILLPVSTAIHQHWAWSSGHIDREGFEVRRFVRAEDALDRLPSLEADLVIMDITLPGTSGIEAMRRMLTDKPGTRVLIFSMHEDAIFAKRALQAGAFGYVTKASAPTVLVEAVHSVAGGRKYLSAEIAHKLALRDFAVDDRGYQTAHKAVTIQWQDGKQVVVWPDEVATGKARLPTPMWSTR